MSNTGFLSTQQSELLSRILAQKGIRAGVRPGAIPVRPASERSRLSYSQQRLWVLDRLQPGLSAYNIPTAVRLEGRLDVGALRRSFDAILRRHRVLCATFPEEGGEPVQRFRSPPETGIPVIDLGQLGGPEQQARVAGILASEARRPFDLSGELLARARLIRLGSEAHVFVLTMHHIVSDGWSAGTFVREMAELYQAYAGGHEPRLPELPIQYSDFAEWQREALEGEALRAQVEYWEQTLSGDLPQLELPVDRPRGAAQTFEGATETFPVDREVAEGLRQLARRHGATPFMVLLAAFKVLLYRYTGERDLRVGTPVAGRSRPELEPLIGFFVNTLVLRSRISPEASFDEYLQGVRAVALGAFAHPEAPFDRLVEKLNPERRGSRTPVFQVMFVLENVPEQRIQVPGLVLERLNVTNGAAKFDLTLFMREAGDSLLGSFEYNSRLFERATVQRLREHFLNLLRSIARAPATPVGRLELFSAAERREMLEGWQGRGAPAPGEPVHEVFRRRAQATPEVTALRFPGGSLTFAELDEEADRLAARLRAAGVGPETRVGIFLERSPEMVAAVWGVLRAGGAYVPLDLAAPPRRVAYQLEDAGIEVVLTRESLRGRLPASPVRVVPVEGHGGEAPAGPPQSPVEMDNLAYVLYTSGSTGRPKGVQVTHCGLANYLLNWCLPAYGVAEGEGAPVHSSLGFDLTITGLMAPLLAGRPVSLVPVEGELEALAGQLCGDSEFSLVKLTPAHMEVLNQLLERAGHPGATRALVVGGEALHPQTVADWRRRNPRTRIFNEYGPTETVVGCCVHEVSGEDREAAAVPIGTPITNSQIHLLDAALEPVPVGAPGEIYIGGMGVARGYAGQPSLTAERFVPDPFGGVSGARLYRSGDLARRRPDGSLLFLGRMDEQVKLRGYRIELGEIEASLRRHPAVEDALVCHVREGAGGGHLAAYLVASAEPAPQAAELQDHLREWLPEYMVPSALAFVDAFPLTSNGKVDRRALLESHRASSASSARYVAPRTAVEGILAAVWAEVLGLERVGVEDDFFELGGHSLLAVQVAFRAGAALKVDLPLRALFDAPTVAALAQHLERASARADASPLERADRSRPLPLSFAQQRLWFLHRLNPRDPSYNIPHALRIRGDLRVDVLRRALDEILRRHEVLRTYYPTVDGEPRQQVHAGLEVPLREVDLRGEDDPQAAARRAVADEMGRPFDLAEPPLFRVAIFRVDGQEHFVALVLHHIVSDAWSTELLVRELVELYTAFSREQPSPLGELPFQYADFAAWQRRLLTPEVVSTQLEHWKRHLGERPPVLQLPTDRPRRVRNSVAGRTHTLSFPRPIREAVLRIGREHAVTAFMATFAAFQALLHRYSGQDDFVVGSPVAERGHPGLDGVIGLFLNMLPIRADVGGDPSLAELLERVRGATLDAFAHQQLPFERLVEAFPLDRDLAHTPLFQVMFTFQHASPRVFELPGVEVRSLDVPAHTARFDITLFVIETGQDLVARMEYDAELFDGSTIERMMRHLGSVLEAMAGDPGQRVGDVPLLAPDESDLLLREWNRTERDFPLDRCLHTLIGGWAEQDPSALAAEFESDRLTRGELDRRANRLARLLRAEGVGPEVPVGICVERSPEMLVGILGILKAGGAYLPLDPAYPVERLSYMVRDSGTRLVLTQDRLLGRLDGLDVGILRLDTDWGTRVAVFSDDPPGEVSSPDNLAYIIYTSGSTGQPKGTMVTHRSVVNHGLAMGEVYGLDRDSRLSQFFSLSFDGSVEDLFPPLLAGGAILCHSNPTQHALRQVMEFYRDKGATVLHLPTALWHHFSTELHGGRVELPPTVRLTSAGGEALAMEKLREYLADTGGKVPFVNVYGPTEATVTASVLSARTGSWDDFTGRNLPIGRPLPNVTLYVLDRHLQPTPLGVPGELYIGGVGVARGYLGRPELTAERFVPDLFAGDGSRLYRTGDRVRYLPDGVLEYLERIDQQVKIRSYRIELAEIEAALAGHPAIADVVVEVKTHGAEDRRIVAYVVPTGEMPPAVEIRRHLERFLPAFMIPSALVPMERFPLTPNGKIDRARLPAPDYAEQSSRSFVAPRTPGEERVAKIWRDVLQLEQVGVDDNFFEVGGHSLLAVRVHERLQAEFQREIPLILLFEHSTVARLADLLGREPAQGSAPGSDPGSDPGESDDWAGERRRALKRQRAARQARPTE